VAIKKKRPEVQAPAVTAKPGTAIINRRAADRLRQGHVWVYLSDIASVSAEPGSLVGVFDERERRMGTAIYSSTSQIALRIVSRTPLERAEFLSLVRQRIAAAVAYRHRFVHGTDAFRVIFGEADQLPGLVVDRYNSTVVIQFLAQGTDQPDYREAAIAALKEELQPAVILERSDNRIKELEQLQHSNNQVLFPANEASETGSAIFTMNGLRFHYRADAGQKTGAFLDQRENYAAAARHARGEALDICTYQGGFALHLNRVCEQVSAVDISRPALEIAESNEQLNAAQFGGREIEWIDGNAFDLLRDYSDAGRKYDTVVLDPPAFSKSKRAIEGALSGYKEINLRALKMLRPGGILITCSCSHHVSQAEFLEMLNSAAQDSHRQLRLLEQRGQSLDHPVLLGVPETSYLKCVIGIVE